MGVHKKQRKMEEVKKSYIKRSSCSLFVVLALFAGIFIGNTATMLYLGQGKALPSTGAPVASTQQAKPHTADPQALAKLEGQANANPTNAEAWIKLGNFCFDHDLPQQAVSAYEKALELKPMNIGVWSDLGVMYRRTKQFEKAVNAFSQAVALDPAHVVSRFNMGIVYLHDLNDKANALKAWKKVLEIDKFAKTPNGKPIADLVAELER